MSAPTHKAKKVLMSTTNMNAQTLHSLLGLRPDVDLDNFNPNDPEFAPIAVPKITDYDLVIIDESSMINEDLYNIIVDETKNTQTKVLFMGDPCLLYTSDTADDLLRVDLGGRRIIKTKKKVIHI